MNGERTYRFKSGTWTVTTEEEGQEWLGRILEISEYARISTTAPLCVALLRVFRNSAYDHDRFMSNLHKTGGKSLRTFARIQDYLIAIEEIYNYHSPKGVRFF